MAPLSRSGWTYNGPGRSGPSDSPAAIAPVRPGPVPPIARTSCQPPARPSKRRDVREPDRGAEAGS